VEKKIPDQSFDPYCCQNLTDFPFPRLTFPKKIPKNSATTFAIILLKKQKAGKQAKA